MRRVLGMTPMLPRRCMASSWTILPPVILFLQKPLSLVARSYLTTKSLPPRRGVTDSPPMPQILRSWRCWMSRFSLRVKQLNGECKHCRSPSAVWSYPCLPQTTRAVGTSYYLWFGFIKFNANWLASIRLQRSIKAWRTTFRSWGASFTTCSSLKSSAVVALVVIITGGFKYYQFFSFFPFFSCSHVFKWQCYC